MNFEEIRNLYAFFNCSKKFIYMNISQCSYLYNLYNFSLAIFDRINEI